MPTRRENGMTLPAFSWASAFLPERLPTNNGLRTKAPPAVVVIERNRRRLIGKFIRSP